MPRTPHCRRCVAPPQFVSRSWRALGIARHPRASRRNLALDKTRDVRLQRDLIVGNWLDAVFGNRLQQSDEATCTGGAVEKPGVARMPRMIVILADASQAEKRCVVGAVPLHE